MQESQGGEIQCAHDGNALMLHWRGQMRLAQGGPRTLNGRRCSKPGFVKVDQLTLTFPRLDLEIGQFYRAGGKFFRVALFFSDHRVRLKLKPRALSVFPKVSNEQGRVH